MKWSGKTIRPTLNSARTIHLEFVWPVTNVMSPQLPRTLISERVNAFRNAMESRHSAEIVYET